MIHLKFNIQNNIDISDWLTQYNKVLRFAYNRFNDNPTLSKGDVEKIVKSTMKNIDLLDFSMKRCAIYKASYMPNKKAIFGSKFLFKRMKNHLKVDKQEWLDKG